MLSARASRRGSRPPGRSAEMAIFDRSRRVMLPSDRRHGALCELEFGPETRRDEPRGTVKGGEHFALVEFHEPALERDDTDAVDDPDARQMDGTSVAEHAWIQFVSAHGEALRPHLLEVATQLSVIDDGFFGVLAKRHRQLLGDHFLRLEREDRLG